MFTILCYVEISLFFRREKRKKKSKSYWNRIFHSSLYPIVYPIFTCVHVVSPDILIALHASFLLFPSFFFWFEQRTRLSKRAGTKILDHSPRLFSNLAKRKGGKKLQFTRSSRGKDPILSRNSRKFPSFSFFHQGKRKKEKGGFRSF